MTHEYNRNNAEWKFYRAAYGILVEDDAVLLAGNQWYEGEELMWTPPGGRAEAGEGLHDALVREFREETGLAVEVGALAYVTEARTVARKFHFLTLAFVVTRTGGTLSCADSTVRDLRFVPIADLAEFMPYPSLGDGLRHWLADRAGPVRYWYFPEYAEEEAAVKAARRGGG